MLCPDILKKALRKVAINTEQTGFLKPEEFTDADIHLLYKLAFSLYESGEYLKAKDVFQRLVIACPFEKKFWEGLGASSQMSENYQEAVTAWTLVTLMDENNPKPYFHTAENFFSLNNIEEAKKALSAAKAQLSDSSDTLLKEKIAALEASWNNQDKETL